MLVPVCVLLSALQTCFCADLTYTVEEGKSPGSYVGDIAADSHLMDTVRPEDRSLITFNQLQVRLPGSSQLFSVNKKTGKLYTAHILDAESMCKHKKECFEIVEVAIQNGAAFMRVLEVKVIIQDINDHIPEFPYSQVNIEFSEESTKGTRRSIPNAVDKDIGVINSQITYQLKKNTNDPFTLSISESVDGTSKLGINLEETLDREVQDSYMVQVIAKDGGSPPKQSILDVYIVVTDVNDNPPIFSQNVYNVSIKNEPSETSAVAILSARDADSGKNGQISYQFSSKTTDIAKSHFDINEITGEIFLAKEFTLEQELTHELYIEARDNGIPPLSSIALVLVNVINQQNNAPTIDVNFVSESTANTVSIPENIKVGSFIAYVRVIDPDVGQNGEVSCVLHHEKFQLQSLGKKRYKVTLKKALDRETDDHHDITITCQDKGAPRLHSESKFIIHVVDVNDVRPQFSRKIYKFSIRENERAKYPVGYINATDPDLGPGDKLTYSLQSTDEHFLPFQISDNGLISTVMSLDHEFQNIYKFKVFVKDNGKPPLNNTVEVNVEIRDENDNAPHFTYPNVNPFTMDIVYYPRHTKNITSLKATDRDSRQNAFLKYEITAGNDKQLFSVNHYTGLLTFTRVVTQQDAGTYDLQFVVMDSGNPFQSATTNLTLVLTVSNKTFESFNVVHIEADEAEENIQLDFLIAIVSVAVTISVIITAFISICYIRYNTRRKDHLRSGMNSSKICEQRQLMFPSNQATSFTDAPATWIEEPDLARSGHDMRAIEKGTASRIDLKTAAEVVYQEIGTSSGGKRRKKTALMYPDCHRVVSMLSSQVEKGDNHKKGTTHSEESPDQYSSHYSLAHTPWIDPNTFLTPIKQRFSCPVEARMSPRHMRKKNAEEPSECRQQDGSTPAKKPWTLPEGRRPNFDYPQLSTGGPTDCQGNVDHLVQLPIPKYYVLESNSGASPPKFNASSSAEAEHSLPHPKYYVLERNAPVSNPEYSEEIEVSAHLHLPKGYIHGSLDSKPSSNISH